MRTRSISLIAIARRFMALPDPNESKLIAIRDLHHQTIRNQKGISMLSWLKYKRGLSRLSKGYCPICYSSPPDPKCIICQGSYKYGHDIPERLRKDWAFWWKVIAYPHRTKKVGFFS